LVTITVAVITYMTQALASAASDPFCPSCKSNAERNPASTVRSARTSGLPLTASARAVCESARFRGNVLSCRRRDSFNCAISQDREFIAGVLPAGV
jgi:hypothetical protein